MKYNNLYQKINSLPDELKSEVDDFIDFLLSKEDNVNKRQPKFGCAKGKIFMAEDFDAPLDDFKNYTE